MGCLKQLTVAQAAKSALLSVGPEDPLAKRPLVQPATGQGRDVFPSNFSCLFRGLLELRKETGMDGVINRD